jgi:DegV family protein with EDD domain
VIQIITDSTSDVRPAEWEASGVSVLPLKVNFGDTSYSDGVDLTNDEFFRMLERAERLPTTSQINPDAFSDVFQKHTDNGDDVVGIFISSKLSGTFHSAEMAAKEVNPEKIFVVDSKIGTFGLAIVVQEAVKMRDAGMSAAALAENLRKLIDRVRLVAMVSTLKFLRMGGRISATTAFMGGVLGILPMVAVKDGVIHNVGKVRGQRSAMQFILKYLNDYPPDTNRTVAIGHSDNRQGLENLREFIKPHFPTDNAFIGEIGAVIGTYIGPGAFGVAYFEKE